MKADDPRLEESRNKLFERVKKIDELMLTVMEPADDGVTRSRVKQATALLEQRRGRMV